MNKNIRKKGIILVFRPESLDDFKEIAKRAYKIDPDVRILGFSGVIDPQKIPQGFFDIPHLVIYLCNPPPVNFVHQSPMLAVKNLDKIEEYQHFSKRNLPCLPIQQFEWGMQLDESLYGDWVVIKPMTMQSSGKHLNMLPTKVISELKPDDFPEDHFIHQDNYYVQKLIRTGNRPFHYRAMIFLGKILYSATNESNIPYPSIDSDVAEFLRTSVASNNPGNRERKIVIDERKNKFALKVAETFSKFPILGIDIIEDPNTKKLYVLEVNSGGNGWHFSSKVAHDLPDHTEEHAQKMLSQYNAFDTAAKAILKAVYKYADK